jgi:hypothetical protein
VFAPGYYKVNYRGLRFRELVRMQGWSRAFSAYWATRFMRPGPGFWMPSLWADTACKREDLSESFWQATKPHRENFGRLGFIECGFLKVTKTLNPLVRDSGGVTYLDPSRSHFGQLLYHRLYSPSKSREVNRLTIAFTAVFENGCFSCTNQRQTFDMLDEQEAVRIDCYDVARIHQEFVRRLQARGGSPRQFPDLESLLQWFNARQVKTFEDRARRRLFLPMSDREVAEAKARLAAGTPSRPPRFKFAWGLRLAVIGLVCLLFLFRHSGHESPSRADTIEYRGQQFKMRRAYATYEDYKDDPNNLDTNELGRIEQAMESAKVPASFNNHEELIHFLVELEFPGYGMGGGEQSVTDDGSKLYLESIEIPQRDKDRVIVIRESGGNLKLVDDFVYGTATNAILRVKLEKQKLGYFDRRGQLIREKQLAADTD